MTLAVTHELWKGAVRELEVAAFSLSQPEGPGDHVEQELELSGFASQDPGVKRPNADHREDLSGSGSSAAAPSSSIMQTEPGSMLTAIFPQNAKTWVARTKDHLEGRPRRFGRTASPRG